MSKMGSLPLAFYKGVGGKFGAVQFKFKPAHYYCSDPSCRQKVYDSILPPEKCPAAGCTAGKMKSREGAVFMEITSAIGKNEYDWPNKISMALSISDLSKLLIILESGQPNDKVDLLHDPGAKSPSQGQINKTLSISTPQGIKSGAFVSAHQTTKGVEKSLSHTVGLDASEVKRLAIMFRHVIPLMLCWD